MLRSHILRGAYQVSRSLSASSLGRSNFFRDLKERAKRPIFRLLTPDDIVLTRVDGLSLYIHASRNAINVYFLHPFEPFTTELFRGVVRPGATVLDIGAQYGHFSLIAARKVGPEGRVYAFEPVPANFALLQRNIQANGYAHIIQAVPMAVGEKRGTRTMFLYAGSESHGMHRHPRASVRETIPVECVTVDEFLGDRSVDVIKMDIEGNEPFALKGMERTILRSGNLVLFSELNPALLRQAGVVPDDYLERLERLGFKVQLIDEDSRCFTQASSRQEGSLWYGNLYCARNGSRS